MVHYSRLTWAVEDTIRDSIRSCYPSSWDENHITYSVLDALAKAFRKAEVTGLDRPFKLMWDARKLRRPEEETLGDIGVVVRLITWAGESLEGVGLIEAKRRDPGKASFSAAKRAQLRKILFRAPRAQLLLYDYDCESSCLGNCLSPALDPFDRPHLVRPLPPTHAVCLPALLAEHRASFNTALYKFGLPFSHQLVARYFRGFDLELDPATVDAVKGNAMRHGGPRTLLLVGVSTGPDQPALPTVNGDLYEPVA